MFDLSGLATLAAGLSNGMTAPAGIGSPASAPAPPMESAAPQPPPMAPPSMPMPQAPPNAPRPKHETRDMLMQLAPMVLSMFVARKHPQHAAAILQGMAEGQDAARTQQLAAYDKEQHRKDVAAEYMRNVAADAQQFDDPVEFTKYLQFAEMAGAHYGIKPGDLSGTIGFPATKAAKVAQAKAAARIKELQTLYGEKLSDPEVQNFTVNFDGRQLKVSDLMGLAGLQIRKADGSNAADVLTPKGKTDPQGTADERAARLLQGIRDANARGDKAKAAELQASYDDLLRVHRDIGQTANIGSFEDFVQRKFGMNPTPAQIQSARREYGDSGRVAPITVNIPGMTGMSPKERVDSAAQDIIERRMAPSQLATFFTGMGKDSASQLRSLVMQRVKQLQPDFNFAEAEANYKYASNTGVQSGLRYMSSVQESIPLLISRAKTLNNGNVRGLNALINLGKSQFNNVDLKRFQTDVTLVADEVAKILQGGGTGGATSDAKLRQASGILNSSDSVPAIVGALEEINALIGYRKKSQTEGTFLDKGGGNKAPTLKFNPVTGKIEKK